MSTQATRLAVFFSGGGTTLQNFIDRIGEGTLPARIEWTLSSQPGAGGIQRAERAGLRCVVVSRNDYDSHNSFSEAVNDELGKRPVDLILLAGFMSLYLFPPEYKNRIMNIHPALVPAFCGEGMYGHHVHEAVIESGVKLTGVTVHFVDHQYDNGPIVLQKAVPVLDTDTADTLATRVQAVEREVYPKAVQLFAENRLCVVRQRVKILDTGDGGEKEVS